MQDVVGARPAPCVCVVGINVEAKLRVGVVNLECIKGALRVCAGGNIVAVFVRPSCSTARKSPAPRVIRGWRTPSTTSMRGWR